MKKIVVASNNKGKIREIKEILTEYEILSLEDVNCVIDVEEDGKTFEENAIKKSKEVFKKVQIPCISDDSGLCINELDGWPGIYTARIVGEDATNEERNNLILEKSKKINDRSAEVKCCLVYYDGENCIIGSGTLKGKISLNRRGNNGFGFDEIFELENGKTLAELSNEEKNQISARKLAIVDLKSKL